MSDRGFRRNHRLAWRQIGDETIVVDVRGRRIYGLNAAGSVLWQALEEPRSGADLAQRLAAGGLSPSDLRQEVDRFVEELLAVDLVEDATSEIPNAEVASSVDAASGEPRPGRNAGGAAGSPPPRAVDPVPRLVWQDEIRAVAQSCNFTPVMPGPCQLFPSV